MSRLKVIDDFVARFAAESSTRARSLIVSLFGDAIAVHGNSVWMGSLIRSLEPLGLNARQLRTAVFRLVNDDWLQSRKLGRRSFYGFTKTGLRHYETAARRVYQAEARDWDGRWTLIATAMLEPGEREELKRELSWLGFGQLAPGVLAHPSGDQESLFQTIHDMRLGERVAVLRASAEDVASRSVMRDLVLAAWDLDDLETQYASFVERFLPVKKAVQRARALDEEQCFFVRTILIDQYRRILLADAALPPELLPAGWPGDVARQLTVELYRLVEEPAECFITTRLENASGPLPAADRRYFARFGGLRGAQAQAAER